MTDNKHLINASIQIVPKSTKHDSYALVDKAIEIIRDSGLKHMVTPLETIIEGPYDEIMEVFGRASKTVASDSDEILVFIKMHIRGDRDVTFEEKTEKWA